MEKENSASGILIGLLMGGIIGAILGLLLAPQPGKETRERLRGKLDETISLGKSAWEEGKEAVTQKKEELQAKFKPARGD